MGSEPGCGTIGISSGCSLEHQQQTTSLSVKEDKKMMEDIKRLRSNIPLVKQYDEAQESLRGIKEHHNDLYTRLKAKAAELSASKETRGSAPRWTRR